MSLMKRVLILLDHGSRRSEAHEHLEFLAQTVREREPSLSVLIAHMEHASPSLEEAIATCACRGAREVWVHPMFLAPGRHLTEDIPAFTEAAARRHPDLSVRLTPALGMTAGLADLILSSVPPN